ncbi:hypothetical protein TrispH2_011953, partial [Trichoplax sp. H2]
GIPLPFVCELNQSSPQDSYDTATSVFTSVIILENIDYEKSASISLEVHTVVAVTADSSSLTLLN